MFDWLRRAFWPPARTDRQHFIQSVDTLNADTHGGEPVAITKRLGNLTLRSGTLSLADPQYLQGLEVPNVGVTDLTISASLRQYPSGATTVAALKIGLGDTTVVDARRKIGEVGIDSAKLVVADKADLDDYWTEVGNDRVGVISTARDDTVLRMLTKRFHLKTNRVNAFRAEAIGPVSESLAKEIEDYLKSFPKYASNTFLYFRVQTNNSFERVNFMKKPWNFMPVGNAETPLMFACDTGRGDGVYDVECEFAGEVPRALSITFIDEPDRPTC